MPILERDDVSIFFEEHGDGIPVLLGHSFLCSHAMWNEQIRPLSQRARVVAPDFRGHGRSGPATERFDLYDLVDDQIAVLDHLGIDRAVWAGLSIGGMVAMRAALAHPERVAALALLDTDAGAETASRRIRNRALAWGVRLLGPRTFGRSIAQLMFGPTTRAVRPGLVAAWKRRFAAVHVPSMLRFLDALNGRDSILDRLDQIDVPALVVVGEEDAALAPERSLEIAARIPDVRVVAIPEAGHLVALESPAAVNEALLDFLDDVGG